MHRLPAETSALAAEEFSPPPEASRHLRAVRPADGEKIELFDGRGNVREYSWDAKRRVLVASAPLRRIPPRPGKLVLFACVTKGARWDWTIEKAVELGADRIVPVLSARTIVRIAPGDRAAKRERWEKIAVEAARQSDAAWVPEIAAPASFAEAAAEARGTACFAGIISDPPPPPLLDALEKSGARPDGALSLFTGPEGDFSPEEKSDLLSFAHPASFGPSILRAETAAIFGLSVISAWRR